MLFVNKIFLEANAGFNSTEREDDGSISVNAQLLSPAFFENITPDSEVSEAVSDGPHAVSLDKKTEVYVNNYSGGGIVEMDGDYPIDYPTLSMAQ